MLNVFNVLQSVVWVRGSEIRSSSTPWTSSRRSCMRYQNKDTNASMLLILSALTLRMIQVQFDLVAR